MTQTHANEGIDMIGAQSSVAPPVLPPTAAPVGRCLLVWGWLTLLATGGTALGVDAALAAGDLSGGTSTFDQTLVVLAGAAAALVCPWLWLVATAAVIDALRGRVRPGAGWIRRLTLTACGCAITLAHVAPAHAGEAEATADATEATSVSVLSGLPFPERPSTTARQGTNLPSAVPSAVTSAEPEVEPSATPAAPRVAPERTHRPEPTRVGEGRTYVVRSGDTLWAIAGDALATRRSSAPTAAETARAVAALHARNRTVLGPDADLILPGQHLTTTLDGDQPR